MKTTSLLFGVLFGAAITIPAFGQAHAQDQALLCGTTDGTFHLTAGSLELRDYHMTFQGETTPGVRNYADPASGASAVLDAREQAGLYLLVVDKGVRMQVVASRRDIRVEGAPATSEPESPASPSMGALTTPAAK